MNFECDVLVSIDDKLVDAVVTSCVTLEYADDGRKYNLIEPYKLVINGLDVSAILNLFDEKYLIEQIEEELRGNNEDY